MRRPTFMDDDDDKLNENLDRPCLPSAKSRSRLESETGKRRALAARHTSKRCAVNAETAGDLAGPSTPAVRQLALPAQRNTDPAQMDSRGFVELPALLSPALCAALDTVSMAGAASISNAREMPLGGDLLRQVKSALDGSNIVHEALQHMYGTESFVVSAAKILEAQPDDGPQIAHSDDHCNRELFGIAHVRPCQAPTECNPYDAGVSYPTGFSAQCSKCSAWVPVPDGIGRRRLHTCDGFECADAGAACGHQAVPPTIAECEAAFAANLYEAYADLLLRPQVRDAPLQHTPHSSYCKY